MDELTPREIQVLKLLAQGMTNGVIAEELGMAYRTTRNHVTSIYAKLKVGNRAEAAVQYAAYEQAQNNMVDGRTGNPFLDIMWGI